MDRLGERVILLGREVASSPSLPPMTGIFISYRREDSGAYAGRLCDALVNHFGREHIFFDIDSIAPGEDFREVIDRTFSSCQVLLAVIGKQWSTASDKTGKLRLEDKGDTLRMEITSALQKGLRVIPVLVGARPDAGRRGVAGGSATACLSQRMGCVR